MSWLLFQSTVKSKITPKAETSDFIDALLDEYASAMGRYTDTMSMGSFNYDVTLAKTILKQIMEMNSQMPPSVAFSANFIDQLVIAFSVLPLLPPNNIITGPLGVTTIFFPGLFLPVGLDANQDSSILLAKLSGLLSLQVKTMFGTFAGPSTSGVPVPWSGSMLLGIP